MDLSARVQKLRIHEDIDRLRSVLLGTGRYYTDNAFAELDDDKTWLRPNEICKYWGGHPIFINGKPSRFDALQGDLGDCWLISAMEAITLNDALINHVVPPDQSFDRNYIGAFHFRIWKLGTWYDVVVDDLLPVYKHTKTLCYAHPTWGTHVFWAALLEKAYAKISTGRNDLVNYDELEGGIVETSLQDFSGGIIDARLRGDITEVYVFKWLMDLLQRRGAFMACEFHDGVEHDHVGLYSDHTYTITKVHKSSEYDRLYAWLFLIRIMNPHGTAEWTGPWSDDDHEDWKLIDRDLRERLNVVKRDDGEFWMDQYRFLKYFGKYTICHIGPGRYLEAHFHSTSIAIDYWNLALFHGEWVKGISSGGYYPASRHINPQYFIELDWAETDQKRDRKGDVVIDLIQRSKELRFIKPIIGFYVYRVSRKTPLPLSSDFMQKETPVFKTDFSNDDVRTLTRSLNLEIGMYVVVPCTKLIVLESQFILRVYTEYRIIKVDTSDNKISKSAPTEEKDSGGFDKRLKRMFYDIAQDHEEINWIGLKAILDQEFHEKTSSPGIVPSLFKFIGNVFKSFLPNWFSCDFETNDLVFTKEQCRSMIAMLDDNHSGKINFTEFSNLWENISFWAKVYDQYTDEAVGFVSVAQLRDALSSIGYNVGQRTAHSLRYVYADDQGNIPLTDFILCGITLETVLSSCQKEDGELKKRFKFTLEEWVKNSLNL